MVHDAYMERYKRPTYKLPIIIFVAIVAVSVFLSTQIRKTKENINVAALNHPVSLDSITIKPSSPTQPGTGGSSPIAVASTAEHHTVVSFDAIDSQATYNEAQINNTPLDNVESDIAGEIIKVTLNSIDANDSVSENSGANAVVDIDSQLEVTEKTLRPYAGSTLDDVYSGQQDKFLQTLARNAIIEQQIALVNNEKSVVAAEEVKKRDKETVVATSNPSSIPNISRENQPPVKQAAIINASLNIQSPQVNDRAIASNASFTTQQMVAPSLSKAVNNNTVSNNALNNTLNRNAPSNNSSANKNVVFVATETELERFLSRFTYFYNSGDINRLMALFADNASTNDSRGKNNIKADYINLFNNTHARRLMINQIKWQVDSNKAIGAADFIVTVLNKNNRERSSIKGKLTITTIKQSQGYYISKLLHDLN